MGSGTDVARESAAVVLLGNDLLRFVEVLKIARRCRGISAPPGPACILRLFEIGPQSGNEIIGGTSLLVCNPLVDGKNVEPDMTLDHFRHQRVHGATAGRDIVKNLGALSFLLEGFLNCPDLTLDSPDTVQQPLFLFEGVCHKDLLKIPCRQKTSTKHLYKDTPAGIPCVGIPECSAPKTTRKEAHPCPTAVAVNRANSRSIASQRSLRLWRASAS